MDGKLLLDDTFETVFDSESDTDSLLNDTTETVFDDLDDIIINLKETVSECEVAVDQPFSPLLNLNTEPYLSLPEVGLDIDINISPAKVTSNVSRTSSSHNNNMESQNDNFFLHLSISTEPENMEDGESDTGSDNQSLSPLLHSISESILDVGLSDFHIGPEDCNTMDTSMPSPIVASQDNNCYRPMHMSVLPQQSKSKDQDNDTNDSDSGSDIDTCASDTDIVKPTYLPCNAKARKTKDGFRSPHDIVQMQCCSKLCLQRLSVIDILDCQNLMKEKNEIRQKQFILDVLKTHSSLSNIGQKVILDTNLIINGNNMCTQSWCTVHNVSKWRFNQCINSIKNKKLSTIHGNKVALAGMKEKTTSALAWMTFLFKRMGDYMPHKDVIHLPHSWTRRYLYERMIGELLARGMMNCELISYAHFTKTWKKNLPQYVISKVCTTNMRS